MKKTLSTAAILAVLSSLSLAADVSWDNSQHSWNSSSAASGNNVSFSGDAGTVTIDAAGVSCGAISVAGEVRLEGGELNSTGALNVNSGTLQLATNRNAGVGNNVTVAAGATLDLRGGKLFSTANYVGGASSVTLSGTLILDTFNYGGSLGNLKDNSDALVLNGGARIEIAEGGSSQKGMTLNGWGSSYTIALAAGKTFTWNQGNQDLLLEKGSGAGCALTLEAGEGATFNFNKNFTAGGLSLNKSGTGTLVLGGSFNVVSGRVVNVNAGTLKIGDGGSLTGAGNVAVAEGATLDLNGQNFGNSIVLNGAGSKLLNAQNYMGAVTFKDATSITTAALDNLGGTAKTDSAIALVLGENWSDDGSANTSVATQGRLASGDSISISGEAGSESFTMDNCYSYTGALHAENGVTINNVASVSMSGNKSTGAAADEWYRAGAIASASDVTVSATDSISFSNNVSELNADAGAALYGNSVTLEAANISLSGNRNGLADGSDASGDGGAIKGLSSVSISASETLSITNNSSSRHGGALYSDADITLENNSTSISATGNKSLSADGNGGFAAAMNELHIMNNSGELSISGNSAGGNGGALYSEFSAQLNDNGTLKLENNKAGGTGGAVDVTYSGELSISGNDSVSISNNQAGSLGGALYGCDISISNNGETSISNNSAGEAGGAIFITDGGSLHIDATEGNVSFSGNTAADKDNDIAVEGEATISFNTADNDISLAGGITGDVNSNVTVNINEDGSGEGCVTLSGNYDFCGSINVKGGTLLLDNASVADSIAITVEKAATFSAVNGSSMTLSSMVLDAGSALNTDGSITLNGELYLNQFVAVETLYNNINALEEGDSLTLFQSSEGQSLTLYLNGELVAGAFDDLNAEDYISNLNASILNLSDSTNADYRLWYDGSSAVGISRAFSTPEPATATLSLLALAGLAARRRRK